MRFCLDTSAFIGAYERHYPPDVFPTVWEEIDRLMSDGRIVAPEDVLLEMKKKSDGVVQRVGAHKNSFLPLDEKVQECLRGIMSDFPEGFVDHLRNRSGADAVVIALARAHGDVVVTEEKPSGKAGRPKIPDVCVHYGIECCGLLEMFRRLKRAF
ncbi:MAG: DUF4411 family protein [Phycisphaerae bacterium]|nr:DUF4411 family protein [Phycisphaerae bacterium]